MGGQISRYALAYMEQKHADGVPKMKHNTRLWVSLDSPHEGANIPISLQQTLFFLGNYANKEESWEGYVTKLRNPAARQLLIEQMDGLNGAANFHTTYYNNLKTNGITGNDGYPVALRKIALVNGASNGITNNIAGETILDISAPTIFVVNGINLTCNNMPESGSALTNKTTARGGGLGFGILSSPWIHSTPTYGMTQSIKHGFTGIIFGLGTHKGEYMVNNYNANGSMDVVPGSTNNTAQSIWETITEELQNNFFIFSFDLSIAKPNHTFIPAISSLDFYNSDFHWATRFDDRDLICTEEIPFDNYYAPKQNEQHVSFTNESAKWVMEEVLYGKADCPTICAAKVNMAGGDMFMCGTTPYTFDLDVSLSASEADVAWELPEGIIYHTPPSGINSRTIKWDGVTTPDDRRIKITITPKIGS